MSDEQEALESEFPDNHRAIIVECYKEFEASGYDMQYILTMQQKIVAYLQDRAEKTGGNIYPLYPWRLFFEYALLHIPKDEIVLRELLLEHLRHTFEEFRMDQQYKHERDLARQFERTLVNSLKRAIDYSISELQAYGLLPLERMMILDDGTIITPSETKVTDKDYEFGILRSNVLTWTANLNQLAYAIYLIQGELELDSLSPISIIRRVEESGKIKLASGKHEMLRKYLEELQSERQEFTMKKFVLEAAGVIRFLLTDDMEFNSGNHS